MSTAERRVVSVLFADLVDFTPLSERLDAEDVAHIQETYFALTAQAVADQGGHVEKYIGDAVMATFGTTHHDDSDPVGAVRAALAICAGTEHLERGLGLDPGTLRVRVGVNTGEVVVTRDDAGWRVTGDTVNVAARLQSAASPGQALLGPETAFGVAYRFELADLGPLALKGKAQPVRAWRVLQERPKPRRGLSMHGLQAPLLGRQEPLAALEQLLEASPTGSASVLVLAPPGVGKSRLVEEFLAAAATRGHPSWQVRLADELERGYASIARLLRGALEELCGGGEVAPAVTEALVERGYERRHAQALAGHVATLVSGAALHAEPVDLYAAWSAALDATAGPAPIWVIEDLHLAGPDLWAFLAYAMRHPRREGRVVVLTARPTADLARAAEELPEVRVLHLEPLPAPVTRSLVSALVGGCLGDDYLDGIVSASGGNPLFVEELLRSWIQLGVLVPSENGQWVLTGSSAEPRLPSTVSAIYQSQLDALAEGPRTVVARGSVPGITFPVDALPAFGIAAPQGSLQDLKEVGLLVGPHEDLVTGRAYTYRHSLLRDTAYGSLARQDRARLHGRFARWLEAHGGPAEMIGVHLALAVELLPVTVRGTGDRASLEFSAEEAAGWLERAARIHLVSSPQAAAALLQRALALPGDSGSDRLHRRLALAEAERGSGRLQRAMEAFAAAGDAARAREDADALVTAALGYESALFASRLSRNEWGATSVELLRAAALALPSTAPAAASSVLAALGQALLYGGDTAGGRQACEDAVSLAEQSGAPGALARALLARRSARTGPEQLRVRCEDGALTAEAAGESDDLELQLEVARLHVVDVLESGDLAAAAEAEQRAVDLVDRLGRPLYFWYPPMWRAMQALAVGDYAAADPLIEQFRAEARRANYDAVDQVWLAQRMRLHLDTDGLESVLSCLEHWAERMPYSWSFGPALVHALHGRREESQRHFEVIAADDFGRVPRTLSWAYVMAQLAEVASLLEDVDAARSLSRHLAPWAQQAIVVGSGALYLGSGAHYLGLCLRTLGDLPAAIDELTAAVTANEQAGARGLAARSMAELARTLRLQGDSAGAGAVAGRAASLAASLGMTSLVRSLSTVQKETP